MTTSSLTVEAYSFESRFPLRRVKPWLEPHEVERADKTILVAKCDGGGTVFAFDFGVLVFVDVAPPLIAATLKMFRENLPREPHDPMRESFTIRLDPSKGAPEVTFDTVILSELGPRDLECIATVFAQSVAIDYYDEDLQGILDKVGALSAQIAQTGRPQGRRSELMKFVASSIGAEVEMISSIALLDKPDFTWEDERAERLYDILRHHLEIRERHHALEVKLTTIREALSHFLEIANTRRALFLETTIVLLIVFEIVIGFVNGFH